MADKQNFENPLSEIISDEVYQILSSKNLLNEKTLRDYQIKKKFKNLRNKRMSVSRAIETIREDYPYLQFDSIRKIIYVGNKNLD